MRKRLIIGLIITLLLSGCQARQVNKVIDQPQDIPEPSTQAITEAPTEIVESSTVTTTNESSSEPTSENKIIQPEVSQTTVVETTKDTVIIAKSEDLNDLDERTMILNEIDALLDEALNNLDALQEDEISNDNIVTEGGNH